MSGMKLRKKKKQRNEEFRKQIKKKGFSLKLKPFDKWRRRAESNR